MTTKTAPPPVHMLLIDPWVGCGPALTFSDDVLLPPVSWTYLSGPSREHLGAVLLATLGHAGGVRDVFTLAARVGQALRARHDRTEGKTDPPVIDLGALFVEDETQRKGWRKLEDELQTPKLAGAPLLREGIMKLMGAGDLLTSMRARAKKLEETIRVLERLTPAGAVR